MIRHISIFYLKKENAALYQKQAKELVTLLKKMPEDIPETAHSTVEMNLIIPPQELPEGGPLFGDVVQMIDFADREAADRYPSHPAHIRMMQITDGWIDHVAAIDFEICGKGEEI